MAGATDATGTVVTYKIKGDKELPGEFRPISIRVSKEINRIAFAIIEFQDGGLGESTPYSITDGGFFAPGTEITIELGRSSDDVEVFKGIVTKHTMRVTDLGSFILKIECRDQAAVMTVGRKSLVFYEKTDDQIINQLITDNGLSGSVDTTSTEYPEMVQHNSTDWDFILTRAEANSLVVINSDGVVEVKQPDPSGTPSLEARFDGTLLGFEGEMDVRSQLTEVHTQSWDAVNQELLEATSSSATAEDQQGDLTSSDLAAVTGANPYVMRSGTSAPLSAIQSWGDAKFQKSRLSKIRGVVKIRGNAAAQLNTYIELEGLGKNFDGNAYISGVYHVVEDGEWVTELTIGLDDHWYSEHVKEIEAPSASGLLPGIRGLHIGKVKQIHEDPNEEYRILVAIPELQQDNMPIWARMGNMYSSLNAGFFFMPEIDDEVILGFLNNDPNQPVILGSLYNKINTPLYTATEENEIKSILTKTNMEIQFNETDNVITITTPGDGEGASFQKIILDDTEQSISLIDDANKNKVVLGPDGVLIETEGDLVMNAQGDITLTSQGNTAVAATGDFTGEGMNVTLAGSTKFSAEGAQAELKGSATTTIEGGIVQIN